MSALTVHPPSTVSRMVLLILKGYVPLATSAASVQQAQPQQMEQLVISAQ